MTTQLALNKKQKDFFGHIISDLKFALGNLTSDELKDILFQSAKGATKATYQAKKQAVKNTAAFLKKQYDRYKTDGIVNSLKSDAGKAGQFVLDLPEKARDLYNRFLKLSRKEQIEAVTVTILTLAIFYATAGGSDLEGGLPDTDIAIAGIGHHRSVFSHSIILGLGIEFAGRFSLMTLEKIKGRMPANRHPVWDKAFHYMDKHKGKAVAAMWLGIGAHLIKDSGVFGGGVTGYKDLPFSMPAEAHQGLFAANGAASAIFANTKV